MTIHEAYTGLLLQLYSLYDNREAAAIADMVIEFVTGQRRIDRIMYNDLPVNEYERKKIDELTDRLLLHIPVQYVLGEAWFAGQKFYVDERVLIPRPETEELVNWVIETERSKLISQKVLDVGTGSGCIAVSIKKKLPDSDVIAIDASEGALNVAKRNAENLQADVEFKQLDFLNEQEWSRLDNFDVIVSNPPYVKQSESADMAKHVLEHEPHLALFVPDEDALLFYKKIASFTMKHLNKGGIVFMEINELLGEEVCKLYELQGYKVELRKDMQGKDRMIKAVKA